MSTITSVGSGLWSAAGTWDAGVPANGDIVIVSAGHDVEFDVDQSGFVAGITLTVNGLLFASLTTGTYYLKLAENMNGSGTLRAGTSAAHYPDTCLFTIFLAVGKTITATNLTLDLNCSEPTYTYVKLSAPASAGDTVLSVDTDVTADIWAVGNLIHVDNINKAQQSEERTIAGGGIAAGTITITAGLTASKLAGSTICLINRNIFISASWCTAVTGGIVGRVFATIYNAIMPYMSCSNLVIGGVISTTTGLPCVGVVYSSNCTVSSVITGTTNAFGTGTADSTFSGLASGCYDAFNNTLNCHIGGLIRGCRAGGNGAQNTQFTGIIEYCNYGAITSFNDEYGGTIRYCNFGIFPQEGVGGGLLSGTITNCGTGVQGVFNLRITGSIINCTTGIYGGSGVLAGATLAGNTFDINPNYALWVCYNTPITTILHNAPTINLYPMGGVESFDASVAGDYKMSTEGGITTNVTAPVPVGYIRAYETVLREALSEGFWQQRVLVPADSSVTFEMWIRKDTSMAYKPRCWIFLESMEPFVTGTPLKEFIFPDDDNNTWETNTYTHTNADDYDKTLIVRFLGKNATGSMFTALTVAPTSAITVTVAAGAAVIMPAQLFCTVNDLLSDPQPPAGNVEILFKEIQAASQTIQQEIGEFIPVTMTRKFDGRGRQKLFIPPVLAVTGLVNDDTAIAATDYILQPDGRFWPNGPYTSLEVSPDATVLSAFADKKEGVELPARWGLYEEIEVTGATLGISQSDSKTTLQVSDGSKISPGAVLLIGSEQELVTGYSTPVAAITTLNGTIDATQETIILTNGALVNIGEILRLGVEQMRILDIATHTLYVQRHWNKTFGAAHATGASVDVYRKFTVVREVNGTVAAAHYLATIISRYLVPADVLFLCKEIATLMILKATSGYAGRTGNQELGTVYYNDAFPRFDLERIRDHYSIKTVR